MNEPWVSEKAIVSKDASVGAGAKIWHNAQVRELANIGENVIISKDAYIGTGVTIGKNSKIQNSALVYEPAVIDDGVFIGPGVILHTKHQEFLDYDFLRLSKAPSVVDGRNFLP